MYIQHPFIVFDELATPLCIESTCIFLIDSQQCIECYFFSSNRYVDCKMCNANRQSKVNLVQKTKNNIKTIKILTVCVWLRIGVFFFYLFCCTEMNFVFRCFPSLLLLLCSLSINITNIDIVHGSAHAKLN